MGAVKELWQARRARQMTQLFGSPDARTADLTREQVELQWWGLRAGARQLGGTQRQRQREREREREREQQRQRQRRSRVVVR